MKFPLVLLGSPSCERSSVAGDMAAASGYGLSESEIVFHRFPFGRDKNVTLPFPGGANCSIRRSLVLRVR